MCVGGAILTALKNASRTPSCPDNDAARIERTKCRWNGCDFAAAMQLSSLFSVTAHQKRVAFTFQMKCQF
jgi:hypothetical protein